MAKLGMLARQWLAAMEVPSLLTVMAPTTLIQMVILMISMTVRAEPPVLPTPTAMAVVAATLRFLQLRSPAPMMRR